MSKIDMEEFSKQERDITRIFIASNLKEAQSIEEILIGHGIDYAVKIEKYVRLGLFPSEIPGVAVYVMYRPDRALSAAICCATRAFFPASLKKTCEFGKG